MWMVVAYLRTLSAPGGPAAERGDAARGEQLFWAKDGGNCGQCHMVGGRGGRIGPESVSRIGAARSVGGARARDSAVRRGDSGRLRDRDGGDARRPQDPRRAQERGHVLGSADDRQRGHPVVLQARRPRSIPEPRAIADAGLRARAAERRRPDRHRALPALAAWIDANALAGGCDEETTDSSLRARSALAVVAVAASARPRPERHQRRSSRRGSPTPAPGCNYGGDYGSQRHSPLTQITPANVGAAAGAVGVSDRAARQVRGDADRPRRGHVHHRAEQHGLGDRRAHRPADLALSPRPARGHGHLLRPRQPRLRRARQPPLHEHARRAPAGLRHEDRRRRLGLGDRRLQAGLQRHRRRRSSSRTRSSSASPAPNTASAASSTPSTPPPASAPGGSGSCPGPARRAARRGKATRGSAAAAPPG